KGGTICVDGNAGDEIGVLMRRGMIAIGGSAGDMLGFHMIAGTVLVFGECGMRPGAGMRRGTLGLFGAKRPRLLPSFGAAATYRPPVVPILMSSLRRTGFRVDESLMSREFELYRGDMLALGQGEILFPCAAAA
ncbi:MAG TPA: hypothetical protein VM452_04890, partial [Caulifigura sp.]|nr:hypothetical protein [Caulifigura sp.]